MTKKFNLSKKDKVFVELENHGISVGIPTEKYDDITIEFSDYYIENPQPQEPVEILRKVINLSIIPSDTEVTLRVYYGESIKDKKLKILKLDEKDKQNKKWKPIGGKMKPGKHGDWAGYLEVETKIGDPPIAVG